MMKKAPKITLNEENMIDALTCEAQEITGLIRREIEELVEGKEGDEIAVRDLYELLIDLNNINAVIEYYGGQSVDPWGE